MTRFWDGRTDRQTDGRMDGRTDVVTALLDLLSPSATQVKIIKILVPDYLNHFFSKYLGGPFQDRCVLYTSCRTVALRKEFVDRPEFPESYSFAANYTRNTTMQIEAREATHLNTNYLIFQLETVKLIDKHYKYLIFQLETV